MSDREEVPGRERVIRVASGVLLVAVPIAVLVLTGQLLLGATRPAHGSPFASFLWICHLSGSAASGAIAHHSLHLLFGGGAVVVFAIYALRDISLNGWPRFSWRLRHPTEGNAGRS